MTAVGEKYLPIFNQLTGATVLTHSENKGKGEGLKTAYRYIKETYANEEVAIVTADSDGQHSPEDIMRIATRAALEKDSLVLGVRNFDGTHVPLRSRVGNKITLKIFETYKAARKLAIHKPAYVDSQARI